MDALTVESPLAIVETDADRRVRSHNSAFERMFLYARGEAAGEPIDDLIALTLTHARRKDGTILDVEAHIVPEVARGVCLGYLFVLQDVTGRRDETRVLRASAAIVSRAFRASPTALAVSTASDKRLLDVNDDWVRLTGFTREEASGRTPLELGLFEYPGDAERLNHLLDENRESVRDVECRFRAKDGASVVGSVSIERFDANGQALRVMAIADVTARQRWADTIVAGVREANAARRDERNRIARDLHDDIAQQLALLQIGIDQLKTNALAQSEEATAQIDRLSHQTNDVIKAIRAVVYNLHPADLAATRPDVLLKERCAALGDQLNLAIDFWSQGVPEGVRSDIAECLLRVLQEAVTNVARHSGERTIAVRLWATLDAIHLTVRDFGAGFLVDKRRGGIGLSTMSERVAAVGGSIWITSRPQFARGTLIAVRLPLSPS